MGIEWTLACLSCRHHAWLGSAKPAKWCGFQAGNREVAALLALHADDCQLVLVSDNRATDTPWLDPDSGAPRSDGLWRQDLRSRWLWTSHHMEHAPGRTFWVCARCSVRLRSEADPAAPEPLVVSPGLWFCGGECLDAYRADPSLVWRPLPTLGPSTHLQLHCLSCAQTCTWHCIDTPEVGAEEVAFWLAHHIYDGAEGAGLEAPGCHLTTRLLCQAATIHPTRTLP